MLRDFLGGIQNRLVDAFRGRNMLFHMLAIALTAALVWSGFDWWYFTHTRGDVLRDASLPAAILGFFVPVLVPVGLYWVGSVRKRVHQRLAATALAQAAFLGWTISSAYKALTGRIQPEFWTHVSSIDTSRDFNFGFFEHGIFWGWPSSHTAVAFAMAAALIVLYPRRRGLAIAALCYAFFIGLGVSVSIHWFSDFVAGAIIGTVTGLSVGRALRAKEASVV